MERLTKRMGGISYSMCDNVIIAKCENCTHRQPSCYDEDCQAELDVTTRLAAYEDIGLTPEQVAELAKKNVPKAVRCNTAEERTEVQKGVVFGKGVQIGFCPTCGMFTTPSHTYCEKCGQALKWPEPPKEE